jgi:hypothetical protein
MAQMVCCWLLIVETQVQSSGIPYWICGGKDDTEAGFLQVLLFSHQALFHQCSTYTVIVIILLIIIIIIIINVAFMIRG